MKVYYFLNLILVYLRISETKWFSQSEVLLCTFIFRESPIGKGTQKLLVNGQRALAQKFAIGLSLSMYHIYMYIDTLLQGTDIKSMDESNSIASTYTLYSHLQ